MKVRRIGLMLSRLMLLLTVTTFQGPHLLEAYDELEVSVFKQHVPVCSGETCLT